MSRRYVSRAGTVGVGGGFVGSARTPCRSRPRGNMTCGPFQLVHEFSLVGPSVSLLLSLSACLAAPWLCICSTSGLSSSLPIFRHKNSVCLSAVYQSLSQHMSTKNLPLLAPVPLLTFPCSSATLRAASLERSLVRLCSSDLVRMIGPSSTATSKGSGRLAPPAPRRRPPADTEARRCNICQR